MPQLLAIDNRLIGFNSQVLRSDQADCCCEQPPCQPYFLPYPCAAGGHTFQCPAYGPWGFGSDTNGSIQFNTFNFQIGMSKSLNPGLLYFNYFYSGQNDILGDEVIDLESVLIWPDQGPATAGIITEAIASLRVDMGTVEPFPQPNVCDCKAVWSFTLSFAIYARMANQPPGEEHFFYGSIQGAKLIPIPPVPVPPAPGCPPTQLNLYRPHGEIPFGHVNGCFGMPFWRCMCPTFPPEPCACVTDFIANVV